MVQLLHELDIYTEIMKVTDEPRVLPQYPYVVGAFVTNDDKKAFLVLFFFCDTFPLL